MGTLISPFTPQLEFDHSSFAFPSRLQCVAGRAVFADDSSMYYGYVLSGTCEIQTSSATLTLNSQMYFSIPGGAKSAIIANGETVVFQRKGYSGLPTFGGPIEDQGRLAYIDNSRATILVHPARVGDPVLNLLVFPPNIRQTSHVHPTSRLGVIVQGSGYYKAPDATQELRPGMVFALEPFQEHCFYSGREGLTVIAYHPDSDVGPTDEVHPMLSRTWITNPLAQQKDTTS